MNAVIDSSVLVALLNPSDLWHAQALALQEAVLKTEVTLIYFDCVVAESISAVARRLHEKGRGVEIVGLLQRLEAQVPRDLITWMETSRVSKTREVWPRVRIIIPNLDYYLPKYELPQAQLLPYLDQLLPNPQKLDRYLRK